MLSLCHQSPKENPFFIRVTSKGGWKMQHNKYISWDTFAYYCKLYNFFVNHDMPRHVENLTYEQDGYLELLELLHNNTVRGIDFFDFIALLDSCAEPHSRPVWLRKAYRRNRRKWEGR